jgi:DNA-binding beta-propeller fold protein YncE
MKNHRLLFLLIGCFLLASSGCQELLEEIAKHRGGSPPPENPANFREIGQIALGTEGAAEITAYDPSTKKLFVVSNDSDSRVDVVDLQDLANPTLLEAIDITPYGGGANSVAVSNGQLAVAVEADPAQHPGLIVFFATDNLHELRQVSVGALPDMVTFSPDGRYALSANEGEPSDEYDADPLGTVSIIDLDHDFAVTTLDFSGFAGQQATLEAQGLRVFGPKASLAQDVEPEYIAVSDDSKHAWVSLQENNALARIDLMSKTIAEVFPLGFKDYSFPENAIDVSDRDDQIQLNSWPVLGMYQPDAIAAYAVDGVSYVITANEGDARDYDGFSEEERVEDLTLDASAFPNAETLQQEDQLGRLEITTTLGDADEDGNYEELYSYGARSFSIWDGATGEQIYDSGNELEQEVIAGNRYDDGRSDAKGVEPEGVVVGKVGPRTIAFIGMERVDAVAVYDVTNPHAPQFLQLLLSGDAPEGLVFVSAEDSPNGKSLFIVSSEGDGVVKLFQP